MSEKMNVLIIITDQQRADMLHCYGNPIINTPNIDLFAKESVRFSNAFTVCPMCMPNRATLLTGYYPNVHGVRSNGINLPKEVPTITQSLVKKGYHTVSIGKTHSILITEDEEVGPHGPLYTRIVHLITKDYKLTKYAELPGYGNLFNRKNDKAELYNLWEKDKEKRLEILDKLFHEYSITRSRFPKRDSGF